MLSLYGRDTEHAFGHLGFTNILGWADPERGARLRGDDQRQAGALPGAGRFFGLMQRITTEAPKVEGYEPEADVGSQS